MFWKPYGRLLSKAYTRFRVFEPKKRTFNADVRQAIDIQNPTGHNTDIGGGCMCCCGKLRKLNVVDRAAWIAPSKNNFHAEQLTAEPLLLWLLKFGFHSLVFPDSHPPYGGLFFVCVNLDQNMI